MSLRANHFSALVLRFLSYKARTLDSIRGFLTFLAMEPFLQVESYIALWHVDPPHASHSHCCQPAWMGRACISLTVSDRTQFETLSSRWLAKAFPVWSAISASVILGPGGEPGHALFFKAVPCSLLPPEHPKPEASEPVFQNTLPLCLDTDFLYWE